MKYYLTTPIYYVNATPHIGHAYTNLAADTIKRFRRMMGDDAYLSTGTDEHGQNVERSARAAGCSPKEFADRVSGAFRRQWDELGIEYDFYVRTTEPRHHRTVQWLFERCRKNGAIEKGNYTGQYCVHCELYVSDVEPGAPCPDCGRPTETVTEENYFFKLSAFQEKLLQLYEQNPGFVQPETRRNEVISFVRGGLKDLSISRSNLKWGISLPDDSGHVFYVWFDALTNYLTSIGYAGGDQGASLKELWPADLHLVGKEILRFHAIYWPAFLMAADLPLPKCVYAHGWLIFQGDKMSKSKGNIVRAKPLDQVVGVDGLRYYLLREIVFGQDGNFTLDALVERYNSDLANGLGNLASRTLSMIQQYFDGEVPSPSSDQGAELAALSGETIERAKRHFSKLEFSRGLEAIWGLIGAVDKYIVEQKPWVLAKGQSEKDQERLRTALYNAAEVVRITAALVYPVLPKSAAKIWKQLGQGQPLAELQLAGLKWGQLTPGTRLGKTEAVFPRLDVREAVEKIMRLEEEALKEQAEILGKKPPAAAPAQPAEAEAPKINIDDFAKVEMRVGVVKSAEKVKGADRLLHLMVDIGEPQPRSIVAGIAEAYAPDNLIGRKVAIVANLKPRKLRGLESNGMIVAATGENGKPSLVGFPEDAPVGARLS